MTDGNYVSFRLTEKREISPIAELLKEYKGIIVTDFYSAYDSLSCGHQKCWVHLIRDMNDDLRKNPFDTEFELFLTNFKDLIIPIFKAIEKYGLKKYHFGKFRSKLDGFFRDRIAYTGYRSELTLKYQKRLRKYWSTLFTFLDYDGIPWNNNTAERGLRHLAVQRKISSHFNNGIGAYLIFLGIMQTCRFQDISFLKFMLSNKESIRGFVEDY